MSRGLGRLQQAILQHLQSAGHWCWVRDITRALCGPNRQSPRSGEVSVRRAVRTLAARGLARLGRLPADPAAPGRSLACWLPQHQAPRLLPQVPAPRVESLVLEALGRAREADLEEWLHRRAPRPEREAAPWRGPGAVPYSWLVRQVRREPDLAQNWVAIHRALKRLSRRGRISAARWGGRRYVFIYLNPD